MEQARYYCIKCGKPITRERRHKRADCVDCALAESAENARQLHRKSGPYYDRWKRACLRAMKRYEAGVNA